MSLSGLRMGRKRKQDCTEGSLSWDTVPTKASTDTQGALELDSPAEWSPAGAWKPGFCNPVLLCWLALDRGVTSGEAVSFL